MELEKSPPSDAATGPLYVFENIDWNSTYERIGRLAVEFEKVPTHLRFAYNCVLQQQGLKVWELGANLLNIPQLGPSQLATAFSAAIASISDNLDLKKRAAALVPRCQDLAEQRNAVLHGEWMIGANIKIVADSPTHPVASGVRRSTGKSGAKVAKLPSVAQLDELIAEATALWTEVQSVSVAVSSEHYHSNPALYGSVSGEENSEQS